MNIVYGGETNSEDDHCSGVLFNASSVQYCKNKQKKETHSVPKVPTIPIIYQWPSILKPGFQTITGMEFKIYECFSVNFEKGTDGDETKISCF